MKKIISLLLVLALTFCVAACSSEEETKTTDAATEGTTEGTTEAGTEPNTDVVTESDITYFSLTYADDFQATYTLQAYPNEDGTIYVEMQSDIRKVNRAMDASVMQTIADAFNETGLAALNGTEIYEEGEASCSMYISYADETMLSANYGGATTNEEFMTGYNAMKTLFETLLADTPEYVAEPVVSGNVDETLLSEINAMLAASGMEPLDMFTISELVNDDTFSYMAGLTSAEGVAAGAYAMHGMITSAYSLVLVTLEEGADSAAIAADFESNIDWMRWVCVQPSNAMIAQKDNMLLCLIADGEVYNSTAAVIEESGWTTVKSLANPNLG